MPRVKRGSTHTAKRKKWKKQTKGYYAGRKNLAKQARVAVKKSGQRAYDHRKLKKRTRRSVWQIKIGAATKMNGMSYSIFIGGLTKKNILLDRKILADIAENHPELFGKIVQEVKGVVGKTKQ
ncbi:MAG TPA: 50S ribosomal protein L20 [Patescibacteria group bacterium]|nr:50S ribosomal protein L20 [Patescibacteria group bacterium]